MKEIVENGIKRLYGVYRATVVNNRDPLSQRRLQLRIQTSPDAVSAWIAPFDNNNITAEVPSIGQGVWVQFLNGDPESPVWLGHFGKNKGNNKRLYVKPLDNSVNISAVANYMKTKQQADGTTDIDLMNTLLSLSTGVQTLFQNITAQGIVGPQGANGSQGATGTQGTTGPQGIQGIQGVQGNLGYQGNPGVQGAVGPQGSTGSGAQGIQGVQGNTGIQGSVGNQGTQGVQGNQGTQGIQGLTGVQGIQGNTGNTGSQGIQGSQGTQGIQGNFGPQGVQGIAGAVAAQGLQGPQGTQGIQGIIGAQGAGGTTAYYGSWHSTQNQTALATNTAYAITYNVTDLAFGWNLTNSSRLVCPANGVYNIQYSAQFHNGSGGGSGTDVNIWLAINGSVISDTDSVFSVNTNSPYIIGAVNYVLSLNANDYVELYWSTANTSIALSTVSASSPAPLSPSIITTVTPAAYSIQGTQGVQGTTGTQGPQGIQGIQGSSVQGVQGVQGSTGTATSDFSLSLMLMGG